MEPAKLIIDRSKWIRDCGWTPSAPDLSDIRPGPCPRLSGVPITEPGRSEAVQVEPIAIPKCCPCCGSTEFILCVEWFAHSMEPMDLHNTGILTEYQCRQDDCGKSWWM